MSRRCDALVPSDLLCAPKSLGVERTTGEASLAIGTQIPNLCRDRRAALNPFPGMNHFLNFARFHLNDLSPQFFDFIGSQVFLFAFAVNVQQENSFIR